MCHVGPQGVRKERKEKNTYTGPPPDAAPGAGIRFDPVSNGPSGVSFHPETLRLPILPDGPDVNLNDRGFPDRQLDYDFLIEQSEGVELIRKTGPEFPTTVDPDIKFDEAKYGAYLREHPKTSHMPASQALRVIDLIKCH